MTQAEAGYFVYCDNNPVMRVDGDGEFWRILVGAAVEVKKEVVKGMKYYVKNMKNRVGDSIFTELTEGILKSGGFSLGMNWVR